MSNPFSTAWNEGAVSKGLSGDVSGVGDVMHSTGLKADTPSMSDEEKEVMRQQALALKAQQQITANQFHYKIDDDGNWTKMSDEEWYAGAGDTERKQWDIYKSQLNRYGQALEGSLPLSKGMQTQKTEEFSALKNATGLKGSNASNAKGLDTLGAQRLNAFNTRWTNIQDQAQQEALGQSGNMVAQGQALTGFGTGNVQTVGATGQYNSLLEPYQNYNMLKYQSQAQNQQTTYGLLGTAAGLAASYYGAGGAGAIAAASKREFKTEIKPKSEKEEDKALKSLVGMKSYEYRYKKKMKLGDEKHLGNMVEESPKSIITQNKQAIDLNSKMELISMSLKSLYRKVDKLQKAGA